MSEIERAQKPSKWRPEGVAPWNPIDDLRTAWRIWKEELADDRREEDARARAEKSQKNIPVP
jgi:hypothetical protein